MRLYLVSYTVYLYIPLYIHGMCVIFIFFIIVSDVLGLSPIYEITGMNGTHNTYILSINKSKYKHSRA